MHISVDTGSKCIVTGLHPNSEPFSLSSDVASSILGGGSAAFRSLVTRELVLKLVVESSVNRQDMGFFVTFILGAAIS